MKGKRVCGCLIAMAIGLSVLGGGEDRHQRNAPYYLDLNAATLGGEEVLIDGRTLGRIWWRERHNIHGRGEEHREGHGRAGTP
jgi:hypothetical protein